MLSDKTARVKKYYSATYGAKVGLLRSENRPFSTQSHRLRHKKTHVLARLKQLKANVCNKEDMQSALNLTSVTYQISRLKNYFVLNFYSPTLVELIAKVNFME